MALLAAIKVREQALFENSAFISAIYMDSRFRSTISAVDKTRARAHIVKVWRQIENLKKLVSKSSLTPTDFSNEGDDEIDQLIKEREQNSNLDLTEPSEEFEMMAALNKYEKEPRRKKEDCVLQFWDSHKLVFPELFKYPKLWYPYP